MNRIKLALLISILASAALLTGCAKTVTPLFEGGKQITIAITLRGTLETSVTSSTKYYLIFNNNAGPRVPFAPKEFVEPGDVPTVPGENYYSIYYPSWKEYIVIDGNAFFVKPPYTSEAIPTKEVITSWRGANENQIFITLLLDKFGPYNERLNFDFITVDKNTKMVKDNLTPLNNTISPYYVYTISDSTASSSDETTSVTLESQDIIDWRVFIQ